MRNPIVTFVEQGFESRDSACRFFLFAVSINKNIKPNSKGRKKTVLIILREK
jgi:hypothetical protein